MSEQDVDDVAFSVGDVVRLRSGGVRMTVIDVCMDKDKLTLLCAWTSDSGYYEAPFPELALTECEPSWND